MEDGTKLVSQANEAFTSVQENILKTTKQIDEIAIASQEQLKGIEQINTAVLAIEKGLQESSGVADELVTVMAQFKTQQTTEDDDASSALRNPSERRQLDGEERRKVIPRIAA